MSRELAVITDEWGMRLEVWTDDYVDAAVFVDVEGPHGGHRGRVKLTRTQANALATTIINAAERVRVAA